MREHYTKHGCVRKWECTYSGIPVAPGLLHACIPISIRPLTQYQLFSCLYINLTSNPTSPFIYTGPIPVTSLENQRIAGVHAIC